MDIFRSLDWKCPLSGKVVSYSNIYDNFEAGRQILVFMFKLGEISMD